MATPFTRAIVIVMDSVGCGELPDAAQYGDQGSDTLGNIARQRRLHLPNLCRLGLANIKPLTGLDPVSEPAGAFGRFRSAADAVIWGDWKNVDCSQLKLRTADGGENPAASVYYATRPFS